MNEPTLLMMAGPPGAGKSTLAQALCQRIARTEQLPEEAIFERPEFAAVGRAFRDKTFPDTAMMLDAYRAIFAGAQQRHVSIVADWAAVGMIEDLPCAQPDRRSVTSRDPSARADQTVLTTHARDVREAWGGPAVLLVLDVPYEIAIRRAIEERGASWVARNLHVDNVDTDTVTALVDKQRRFAPRVADVIEAHRSGEWIVHHIDANREPHRVLGDCVSLLGLLPGTSGSPGNT